VERLYKIVNLSRPAIYIIVTILLLAPLVRPLGLPVPISDATRNYKAAIDSMSPGDIMWILSGLNVEMGVELMPGMTATANYAYNNGIKIVLSAPTPAGYEFSKQIVADLQSKGAVYGEDIVDFGYIPGEEAAIAALLGDFHRAAPTDANGTPVGSIPLMQRVKSGTDFSMAVVVTGDASAPDMYTRQFQPFPNCMLTFSSQGTLWPKIQTYLPTGQVKAAINSQRGAAEFELLTGLKGRAAAAMDATSIGWLTFVGLVIFGNLAHYLSPKVKAGKEGE
jgi:hypothetical protein